jgi:hypothetical protein
MLMHLPLAARDSFVISAEVATCERQLRPSPGTGSAPLIPLGLSRVYRPLIMVDEPCAVKGRVLPVGMFVTNI